MGKAGDLDGAALWFDRSANTAPGYAQAWLGTAGVHRGRKDWSGYFDAMRKFVTETETDVAAAMESMARILSSTALAAEAREIERCAEELRGEEG